MKQGRGSVYVPILCMSFAALFLSLSSKLVSALGLNYPPLQTACKSGLGLQLLLLTQVSYTNCFLVFYSRISLEHLKLRWPKLLSTPTTHTFYLFHPPVELVTLFSFQPPCIQLGHYLSLCLIIAKTCPASFIFLFLHFLSDFTGDLLITSHLDYFNRLLRIVLTSISSSVNSSHLPMFY